LKCNLSWSNKWINFCNIFKKFKCFPYFT
jgi:hypothetical protein